MHCKELEPGMILFLRREGMRAWFLQRGDCIFPRMRIGTLESSKTDSILEFVPFDAPMMYLGQQMLDVADRGYRRVRLFYVEGIICYVECFNVHSLEV
jgi:hypothetical protein